MRQAKIIVVHRREVEEFSESTKVEQHITDLKNPDKDVLKRAFGQGSCLYIAIGAGAPSKISKEELYDIDVTIPSALAKEAKSNGIRAVTLLGSTGPDINATYSALTGTMAGGGYYRHCKGQVEENIKQLNFESTNLMRPAGLLGNSNTPKFAEMAIKAFNFITPVNFKGIEVKTLAQNMIKATESSLEQRGPSVNVYEGSTLFAL